MLEISYLTKKYGTVLALSGVSFRVEHGQILGLLGPNGAGKSTIMSIISGYIPKSSGKIRICGLDIDTYPYEVRRLIGYQPEHTPLPVNMTVEEFLEFSSDLKCVKKQEIKCGIERVEEIMGLTDIRRRLIRNISKGYRQRVGIAQALIGFPEVLILDEPTDGLDPSQLIEMRALLRGLGKSHTVLFSSHILSEVETVCDRVVILNYGRVLADNSLSELTGAVSVSRYGLSTNVTLERLADALTDAGIEFSELIPLNSRLEDAFTHLLFSAEHEDKP